MHIEINQTYKNLITIESGERAINPNDIAQLKNAMDELHQKYSILNIMLLLEKHSHTTVKGLYTTIQLALNERKNIGKVALLGTVNLSRLVWFWIILPCRGKKNILISLI